MNLLKQSDNLLKIDNIIYNCSKKCLELIKECSNNIVKTFEENFLEIYKDISALKYMINTIPISSHIIKNALDENNIDSSCVTDGIYNINLKCSSEIMYDMTTNNIILIGYGEFKKCKWIVCKVDGHDYLEYIILTQESTNDEIYKIYKLFDNKKSLKLLNFTISKEHRECKLEKKHIPYELMIDFDKTFVNYDNKELERLGLLNQMKFLHLPELILNKSVCTVTTLGQMIIDSGMKFNIVTSRRKIGKNEDKEFKNVLQKIAPNIEIFSMQEVRKYDKKWQAQHKYNRSKKISDTFIFFDDDINVIDYMKLCNNSYIHYDNEIISSKINVNEFVIKIN